MDFIVQLLPQRMVFRQLHSPNPGWIHPILLDLRASIQTEATAGAWQNQCTNKEVACQTATHDPQPITPKSALRRLSEGSAFTDQSSDAGLLLAGDFLSPGEDVLRSVEEDGRAPGQRKHRDDLVSQTLPKGRNFH